MATREWADKDYYQVLGVPSSATKDEIKKAYRKLAQQFHPDANEGNSAAEARFKEISEAHAILSNDEKRKEYDQMRALIGAGGGGPFGFRPGGTGGVRINLGDLFGGPGGGVFDDFLGNFGFGPERGQDLETEVTLPFEDAVRGTTVAVAGGTRVRIPPGVADGARIRVPGKGGTLRPGAPPGDLYVKVHVRPHPVFSLGKNGVLEVTVPVTFPEAALGANVAVPTLDGQVTVKVPAGTQHGKTLRVRGKGAPTASGGRGDLLVRVEVEVPRKLSRREREVIEEFARMHASSPRAHLEDEIKKQAKAS